MNSRVKFEDDDINRAIYLRNISADIDSCIFFKILVGSGGGLRSKKFRFTGGVFYIKHSFFDKEVGL
jgi:hypothetical protein